MKIIDKKISNITADDIIKSKFTYVEDSQEKFNCNILNGSFYLDSHNYFPITEELNTFLDVYSWGDLTKYNNFYSKSFINNFKQNKPQFQIIKNVFVLGSSSQNNYYRNIITFLPRLFYNNDKIKIAIHRNTSNKLRKFIKILCYQMKKEINFFYLDDKFYSFQNSSIPQFINKNISIKILNKLKVKQNDKKLKLYITRKNCIYRNLLNEDDVINILKNSGYMIIDLENLNILEQIQLFSNAESIISATGSGLTNTIFCHSGTKIYELSPIYNHDYEEIFKNRYSSISKILNLKYNRINAESIDRKKNNKEKKIISTKVLNESNYYKDLIIKISEIEKILNN